MNGPNKSIGANRRTNMIHHLNCFNGEITEMDGMDPVGFVIIFGWGRSYSFGCVPNSVSFVRKNVLKLQVLTYLATL
jgi:hypothetical protein